MAKLPSYGRCAMCGEIFERSGEEQIFCSRKCQQAAQREMWGEDSGKESREKAGGSSGGRQTSFLDELDEGPEGDTWLLRRLDRKK